MELCEIFRKLLETPGAEYYKNQEKLAKDLDLDQPDISRILNRSKRWEQHFRVIKKIILDIDPMALYDDPYRPRGILRHMLNLQDQLPEDLKTEFWEGRREKTEQEYNAARTAQHATDAGTTKPRGKRKSKARC